MMGVEWDSSELGSDTRLKELTNNSWTSENEKVEGKERAGVGTGRKQVLSDSCQCCRLSVCPFEGVPS